MRRGLSVTDSVLIIYLLNKHMIVPSLRSYRFRPSENKEYIAFLHINVYGTQQREYTMICGIITNKSKGKGVTLYPYLKDVSYS